MHLIAGIMSRAESSNEMRHARPREAGCERRRGAAAAHRRRGRDRVPWSAARRRRGRPLPAGRALAGRRLRPPVRAAVPRWRGRPPLPGLSFYERLDEYMPEKLHLANVRQPNPGPIQLALMRPA